MEVTGKKRNTDHCQASSSVSSNVPRVLCQPCVAENESVEADGFCQNCQEYLCGTCIKYHRKMTVSKHHTILDKANMPTNIVPQTLKQLCTETCEKHKLEIIKYFCKNHNEVGCGNCMVIDHKSCEVEFIPDIAEEYVNGEEFKAILTKLEKLKENVGSMLLETEEGKQVCCEEYDAAIKEIRKFRKDVEEYLNSMEQSLIKECERLVKKNEKIIEENRDFLKGIKSELDGIGQRLKPQSTKTTDMFVNAKQTNALLERLEEAVKPKEDCVVTHYMFQRDIDLDVATSGNCPFGKLSSHFSALHSQKEVSIVEFEPVFSYDINVRLESDKKDAIISNMILLSLDKLLCVDRGNGALKVVVDNKQKCISSQIYLTSYPWDITFISVDQIAITLPYIQKINFLSITDNKLTRVREIKVNGECRGITYYQNSLVVSFVGPSNLQTLTLNGKVTRNFTADYLGWCGCLVTSVCGNYFFASDLVKHVVWKFSFDGNKLETYRDERLKSPRSVSVCKDGSLLVCSSGNNELHLMSQDCRKLRIFPIEKNKLNSLQSACFSETTSTLYCSNYNGNSMLVYKQA